VTLMAIQPPPANSRVYLRRPSENDIPRLLESNRKSQSIHHSWVFPPLSESECREYVLRCRAGDFEGLLICTRGEEAVAGVANLSQIFYRAFQSAYLGFYAYAGFTGRGLMSEGLRLVLDHAFRTLGLHRVEANIQPGNDASLRLVQRLGFVKEGFSRRYLKIGGEWRDHERWALLAEEQPR
jgi:[ribosomal protein S5]-alanine N-acetyltransferase